MNNYRERWYHIYFGLILYTSILALLGYWLTDQTKVPVIIAYGLMGFLSAASWFAEAMVMGLTAKAGGFFWTLVTCFAICWSLT